VGRAKTFGRGTVKIIKGTTPQFDNYEVYYTESSGKPRKFLWFQIGSDEIRTEHRITDVVEADDTTGLVVRHIRNKRGDLLYTNGKDDIAIDNTAKILLLLPNVRAAIIENFYIPKLVTSYETDIHIRYKGTTIPPLVPKSASKEIEESESEKMNA
jgi:hypothetical protein